LISHQNENDYSFRYSIYGLAVESTIEIPELSPIDQKQCDVKIKLGAVPEQLDGVERDFEWIAYSKSDCLLRIPNICRFLVENGKSITVCPDPGAYRFSCSQELSADIRVFLLGSAFGALIHQRGWLPLHISAVDSPSGVWAFTGASGAGKSTIAGWIHRKMSWPMISDDVSVIQPELTEPLLFPGPRKLKLWQDAIDYLGCQDERFISDLSNTKKKQLFLSDRTVNQAKALRALVLLEKSGEGEPPSLNRLSGVEAFNACMSALYRPYMAEWFRNRKEIMADLLSLCDRIDVYKFRRQWSLDVLPRQMSVIFNQIKSDSNSSL